MVTKAILHSHTALYNKIKAKKTKKHDKYHKNCDMKQIEKEIVDRFANHLSKYFELKREVSFDRHNRIDVLLTYKKDDKIIIGVEFKKRNQKQGNDYVGLIKQANRYSKKKLNGNYIPVFIHPPISEDFIQIEKKIIRTDYEIQNKLYHARHEPDDNNTVHHNLNSMLSLFNIGEYKIFKRGNFYRELFIFNNKIIWSNYIYPKKPILNNESINYENYNYMITKINYYNETFQTEG